MKPTPAQIEAARKVMVASSCFGAEVCTLEPCKCAELVLTNAVEFLVITAAQEVGKPTSERIRTEREITFHQTIERCAQVAENFNAAGKPIAAAIRKLKDKPT